MLHLPDVGGFAVQQFLAENFHGFITAADPVPVPDTPDQFSGISLDDHTGNLRVGIFSAEPHPCEHIRHETDSRVWLGNLPASAACHAQRFRFDSVIFMELVFQSLAQPGAHTVVQNTSDLNLSQVGGFQQRYHDVFVVFHIITADSMRIFPVAMHTMQGMERM